jgi:hypothetical protein
MTASVITVVLAIAVTAGIVMLFVLVSFFCSRAGDKVAVERRLHLTRRLLEARLTTWQIRHDGRVLRRELEAELRRR